jgi:hypothetical protein
MDIAIALILMAIGVAVWKLKVIGLPQAKERLAHRLLASAAGDRARAAAIAAAMRQTVRLEVAE